MKESCRPSDAETVLDLAGARLELAVTRSVYANSCRNVTNGIMVEFRLKKFGLAPPNESPILTRM
jgi:hypothetical protein